MSAIKEDGYGKSKRVDDELFKAQRGDSQLARMPGQPLIKGHNMRQQKIVRPETNKKRPTIIDNRTSPAMQHDRSGMSVPVRTVMYVEVGDMDQGRITMMGAQFAKEYEGCVHGPHYFIPVRNGRLRTEVEFESQFLETVREICEVVDGKISLKNGHTDVQVMRNYVDGEP